ncbi:hypothetical protein BHC46_02685 [Snodgrassella alvi]|uniref:Uncharacterized protein n=1 Tax=Snodgrassella alvi TaxID=1196083 RepID=A0A2N9XLF6_9NEIS|nr:hypothetical protein [Snodgrassella alvi]PIT49161.1 hypothetical protein BHC46_02685 [Snodgrassella alvi]
MKKTGNLADALRKYAACNGKKVRVGIFEKATYAKADGEPLYVAQVAYWNEYGAQVHVPEHQVTLYRLINEKTGDFRRNGRFVKRNKANFATTHTVPAHTINIPARPFFRTTIRQNKAKWMNGAPKLLEQNSVAKALRLTGEMIKGDLVESINTWKDPPNSKSTIAKKGSDAPLRDTMQMARAIGVEVSDDDES